MEWIERSTSRNMNKKKLLIKNSIPRDGHTADKKKLKFWTGEETAALSIVYLKSINLYFFLLFGCVVSILTVRLMMMGWQHLILWIIQLFKSELSKAENSLRILERNCRQKVRQQLIFSVSPLLSFGLLSPNRMGCFDLINLFLYFYYLFTYLSCFVC